MNQQQDATSEIAAGFPDDRKTLMMPLYEANAYEEALNVAVSLLHDDPANLSVRATLARLRDRIERARVGHWGRR